MRSDNDIGLTSNRIRELLTGASFDKFSYSGIYTMTFTLKKSFCGLDYCNIDIATKIVIKQANNQSALKEFSIEDFLQLWGKVIIKVKLENDLSLTLFFENFFSCKIHSYLDDAEDLFDMRWALYQNREISSLSVWVSDEENIYLQAP